MGPQAAGKQPHWVPWQAQVAFSPHWLAGPLIWQGKVQKCWSGSPRIAHSVALVLAEQSVSFSQNRPTPMELPVSPGKPQAELYLRSGLPMVPDELQPT